MSVRALMFSLFEFDKVAAIAKLQLWGVFGHLG
jgi:hypothetical protein